MIKFINLKNNMLHYLKLKKWLNQKEVLEFYEGKNKNFNYKIVKNKFKPKIMNKNINAFFIIFKNKKIGYFQFYNLDNKIKIDLNYNEYLLIIGFDLFLSKKYQNKGLGKKVVYSFIKYLEDNKINYDKLIVDPLHNNLRAIKCYKDCNFIPTKLIKNFQLHNGIYQDVLILEFNK